MANHSFAPSHRAQHHQKGGSDGARGQVMVLQPSEILFCENDAPQDRATGRPRAPVKASRFGRLGEIEIERESRDSLVEFLDL